MPGFLLHVGAKVTCAHSGQAAPTAPNPHVLVSGMATVIVTTPYKVTGCTLPSPPAANGPCVTALWTTGTTHVLSNGLPLLVVSSQAKCAPTGTPLIITVTQTHVSAI